jgi:hypothetical protein
MNVFEEREILQHFHTLLDERGKEEDSLPFTSNALRVTLREHLESLSFLPTG